MAFARQELLQYLYTHITDVVVSSQNTELGKNSISVLW